MQAVSDEVRQRAFKVAASPDAFRCCLDSVLKINLTGRANHTLDNYGKGQNMNPIISDDPADAPCTFEEINDFLDLEDYDGFKESLSFLLRAECRDRKYWVWSYLSDDNSVNCVVATKMQTEGKHPLEGLILGCGTFDTPIANRQELVAEMLQKNV